MNEVYPVYGFDMNLESNSFRTFDMPQSWCVYVYSMLIARLIVQIIFPEQISSDFVFSECSAFIFTVRISFLRGKRWENVKVTN